MEKKSKRSKHWVVFVFAAVSAVLGFFAARFGLAASGKLPPTVVIANAVLFIPNFFVVIGLHELGHAIAGVWMKFDFRMYVVGPFMWDKESTGWKFKWNKNVNTAGGMVICMPTSSEDLRKRFSIYAAGGPVASLIWAVIAYLIYYFFVTINPGGVISLQITSHFFITSSFLSLVIFIVTSIPVHMGGFSSDGARVLRLQRGGDSARFEILILKIISSSSNGVRPSSLIMDELEEASALAKKLNAPFGIYLHGIFHQVAFDRGDLSNAEIHLKNYLQEADAIPDGIRSVVWLDAAFFYAYAKKDMGQADFFWKQFKPSAIISKAQVFATEAAIALLRNERENGLAKVEAALNELPNMIDKGVAVALRDKLLVIKEHLDNALLTQETTREAIIPTIT